MRADTERHIWDLCQAVEGLSGIEVTWKNPSGRSVFIDEPDVCSHCNSFCMHVKKTNERMCRLEENRNAMSQALSERRPVRFTCHAGGVQLVIPIFAGERFEGVLLLGPLRSKRNRCTLSSSREEYSQLPVWDDVVIAYCKTLLEQTACLAASLYSATAVRVDKDINDLCIARVCSHIANHLGSRLRAEELARLASLSVSRFLHRFREASGMSLSSYIDGLRMERAKDLLMHTDLRIGDIAYAVGACHQNYFSQQFSRSTGLSPLAFRRKYQNEKGI